MNTSYFVESTSHTISMEIQPAEKFIFGQFSSTTDITSLFFSSYFTIFYFTEEETKL